MRDMFAPIMHTLAKKGQDAAEQSKAAQRMQAWLDGETVTEAAGYTDEWFNQESMCVRVYYVCLTGRRKPHRSRRTSTWGVEPPFG